MAKTVTVRCTHCDGELLGKTLPKHSRGFGLLLIVLGILCFFLIGGCVLALPFLLIGLYMYVASRKVLVCEQCGAMVERVSA